jgi:hypothetical protein
MNRLVRISAGLAFLLIAAPAGAGEPQEKLSLDQAFEQLKAYEYGQSRRPLAMLELEIIRATADPARKAQVADRLAVVERLVAALLILYNVALLKNVLDRQIHIRHVKALVA